MSSISSKKFRKIIKKIEIQKLLKDRSSLKTNIVWQPLAQGRLVYTIAAILVNEEENTCIFRGNFSEKKFDDRQPIFFSLAGRITIFKAELKEMSSQEIVINLPDELTDEELRTLSRTSFEKIGTFNNATLLFPNIYIKYSNPTVRVKIKDISPLGMGLALTLNQCQYLNVGEKIILERLGVVKMNTPGEVVYLNRIDSNMLQDRELAYRVGIKFSKPIPQATLDQFFNYVSINESQRPGS